MVEICQLCETIKEDEFEKLDFTKYYANTKEDGERILAVKKGEKVELWNRRNIEKSFVFPEIVEELKTLPYDGTWDGEVVSFDGLFNSLQKRALLRDIRKIRERQIQIPVIYKIFDILELNGNKTTQIPLIDRKKLFEQMAIGKSNLEVLPFVEGEAEIRKLWDEVNEKGKEGIILKLKDSTYEFRRSFAWLKRKTWHYEELTFYKYQNNPNGSITVENNDGDRCLVSGKDVDRIKTEIDTNKKVDIFIKYLEKTKDGRYRFIHYETPAEHP
jgi:ATP-dependent DNA ligase